MTSDSDTPGASRTARAVAWLRAAHQIVDAEPRILSDPIAVRLLGPASMQTILDKRAELEQPAARGWRSHVVLRSRFTEDRLRAAVARGVTQYVLLGAGFDTFAYRQPAWAEPLRIFEVDQPASQRDKMEAVAQAGLPTPQNIRYVPVNFEHDRLDDRLLAAGFDPARPTFVSWLGVMVYVTEAAADAVFRFVAAQPAGSEIVFTFAPRGGGVHGEEASEHVKRVAAAVAAMGEPWQNFVDPAQLSERLLGCGFSVVSILTPDEAAAAYFAGRGDGLVASKRATIAAAIV